MAAIGYENVLGAVEAIDIGRPVGRISGISNARIEVSGLSQDAAMGDLVRIRTAQGMCRGEVVSLDHDVIRVLPDSPVEGMVLNARVTLLGPATLAPDDSWIGQVVDPYGDPFDDSALLPGPVSRRLTGMPLNPTKRRGLGPRLSTGLCVFNTLLPIVRGQRLGLFAGSGVGKSTVLSLLTQKLQADVVVIAMIGERGREVRDFVQHVLGPEGMARTVIVAATSDRSAALRRRCAWAAATVAEHFRDQGRHVLLLADSITRFADAHREIALASGEVAGTGGFPPSTAALITAFSERAGPGIGEAGDITAVFTVLVAGSDMDEPVADILRGTLDGHIVLDRAIAERGRFPAIDVLRSVSRALPAAASADENILIGEARRLLGTYQRAELMIQSGLYAHGSDPNVDAAIVAWPKLDAFVAQRETRSVSDSFAALRQCLGSSDGRRPAMTKQRGAG